MKRVPYTIFSVISLLVLVGLACNVGINLKPTATPTQAPTSTPTLTPTPTSTPLPTDTPTPLPTDTPEPTETPVPTDTTVPTKELGPAEYASKSGGYIFSAPEGYTVEVQDGQSLVSSPGGLVIFLMMSVPLDESAGTLALFFDVLAGSLTSTFSSFESGEHIDYTIGGKEGLATDYVGEQEGVNFAGTMAAVNSHPKLVFFAWGFTMLGGKEAWEKEYKPAFEEMLASVEFVDILDGTGGDISTPCEVAVDATYGYSKDNPIRVGGDAFGGPSRERAYLDTLLGPNGEAITYERLGSETYGDTILDDYQITYAGLAQPISLYIDEYSYEQLKAPLGFTCAGDFPIGAP